MSRPFASCNTASAPLHPAGSNEEGQLGNGGRDSSNVPVQAAAGLTFTALSAGDSHACGIDTAGRTHCWGQKGVCMVVEGCRIVRERCMPEESSVHGTGI